MSDDPPAMTLREQCEALLQAVIVLAYANKRSSALDHMEAFARHQQAVGLREAALEFDRLFLVTDHRLDQTRDFRKDEFYKWCEQRAREREGA